GHLGRALEGYLLLPLRADCVEARPGLEVALLLEIEENQVRGRVTPLNNAAVRPSLLVVGRRGTEDRVEDPDQGAEIPRAQVVSTHAGQFGVSLAFALVRLLLVRAGDGSFVSQVSQAALDGGYPASQVHRAHLMQARHGVLIPRPEDAMELAAHLL